MRLAFLALALTGCAAASAQGPASTRCRTDADCVIVHAMPSCGPCAPCPLETIALSARWVARQEQACETWRTHHHPPPPNCVACPRPPASTSLPWQAVCESHECAARLPDAGAPPPPSIDDLLETPTS